MTTKQPPMSFWRANSLSLVVGSLFLILWAGQFLVGYAAWNSELKDAGAPLVGLREYATSGHFVAATFENWESEFLQMGMYVLLTVWFRQRGSAESRPFSSAEEDRRVDPGPKPWPLRRGRLWRRFYEHSLSIALLLLFAVSFVLHACGSWQHEVARRRVHSDPDIGFWDHFGSSQFWFESLQNWQSEFLAVLAIVLLSIALRENHSPESKPLHAPHSQTGA